MSYIEALQMKINIKKINIKKITSDARAREL